MGMTFIENILSKHSGNEIVKPGEIVDVEIDVRAARDFGGPNVVKNLIENNLKIDDPAKTFFTFDTNPTGSDQKYAENQQVCRNFARAEGIKIFDINIGIGTHLVFEKGIAVPGSTLVSTDSHANILGAIGAFGQGMGDRDIAATFANGSVWFKVPESVKLTLTGKRPDKIAAKDVVLNLLNKFGANQMLGYAIELYGEEIDKMTLDERITISSMATEMGAIAVLFTPSKAIMEYCEKRAGRKLELIKADVDAHYAKEINLDFSKFKQMISRPGHPEDTVEISEFFGKKIDSAFIGSCTNGRYEDMKAAAEVLKGRKVAPGVVLKIVPSTDELWNRCLDEGIIKIFKDAGVLVGNAGCAGCAAGQIGQNGTGEVTISTGNRNFTGKQGKGFVYLASPADAAASAVAGYITTAENIPKEPALFEKKESKISTTEKDTNANTVEKEERKTVFEGKVWIIAKDDIDTDMIFHNKYLAITEIDEMGQYSFDNLDGWKDYAKKSEPGDIIITGKNFGAGSSRQQAVDCFKSLENQVIIAESFGAIYERNAINAAFPVMKYKDLSSLELKDRDTIRVDIVNGMVTNLSNNKTTEIEKFSKVQMEIYKKGGLLK